MAAPAPMARGRRYLALWFPWFPCERARPEPAAAAPFALVARVGNALRLAAVSAEASTAGLAAGMTLADARARRPDLATAPHDPAADTAALDRLVARMRRFSPMVAADVPHGIVLDVTGCAHLFGGEAGLVAAVCSEAGQHRHAPADEAPAAATTAADRADGTWRGEAFTIRHARAETAAAARALARFGRADTDGLHALPVAALEIGDAALAGLRRAGLVTLGDLARRPMAPLAARFGGETVARLRAILGEVERPIAPLAPQVPIRAEQRFAEPMARTEFALATIRALLADCDAQMAARHLGGRQFVVVLDRADGAQRRLEIETARPLRDPRAVMRLLGERIDSLADPLDPGFGFDAIRVLVPRTEPLAPQQIDPDAPDDETLVALVERLATRLGAGQVRRLVPRDSHVPERAQRTVAAGPARAGAWCRGNRADADPDGIALRPLLLLDPPLPVSVMAEVPDGPPLRFRWREALHEVRLAEGPERIAAEWWRHPRGHLAEAWRPPEDPRHPAAETLLTRDYYRIETRGGQRLWIFRHGLYSERTSPAWYIHGLFA